MNVLVANLGSTTYKYTLFKEENGELADVANGKYERLQSHGDSIEDSIKTLIDQGHLQSIEDLDAVGFKTVMGGEVSGCLIADDHVLEALDKTAPLAPAHNPPYAEGIRQFTKIAPKAKLVALFETAFYQWTSPASKRYAVPETWHNAGVRRYGFHGASHKFIAERSAELMGRDDVAERVRNLYHGDHKQVSGDNLRVISCHLGGSSSVTGILNGVAIGTSMGLSPQSGLPQNNRVGDLDTMAIPFAHKQMGLDMNEIERQLTKESGLLGLSAGQGNDIRDLKEAADSGNDAAKLALDFLIHEIRRWASSFLFDLGGIDAIVFTAGIGENNPFLRKAVCEGLESFGLSIDNQANDAAFAEESIISSKNSKAKIIVIPANEEKVVATEAYRLLNAQTANA